MLIYSLYRWLRLVVIVCLLSWQPAPNAATFSGLGDLAGGAFMSRAIGISADGSVVVGSSASTAGDQAFRWTSGGGMVGLGDLPGGAFASTAHDVSADGTVIVGSSASPSGTEP